MTIATVKAHVLAHKKWAIGFVIILVIGGLQLTRGKNSVEYTSAKSEHIDLIQSVSETGQVVSDVELNYGWEASGRVVEIKKKVGDKIKKGEMIARIENTRERARLNEGLASLAAAQARLNIELVGPSEQDRDKSAASVERARSAVEQKRQELEKTKIQAEKNIETAKKNVQSSENDLQKISGGEQSEIVNDSYENLVNTLKSAVVSTRSALGDAEGILGLTNMSSSDDFEGAISFGKASSSYNIANSLFKNTESMTMGLGATSDHNTIDAASQRVLSALDIVQKFLFDVQTVLTESRSGGVVSQTQLDSYKTTVGAGRTNVATATTNVTKARQSVLVAKNSLSTYSIAYEKALFDAKVAEKQASVDIAIAEALLTSSEASLRQIEAQHSGFVAPPRSVDVAALRADVARAAANVQALRDDVRKTELVALADGVLAKLDVDVGETAVQNQQVVRVNSTGLSVKVDISESDVSKLSVNDSVSITLDAFGEKIVFDGAVTSIEPSETEVSGVVYYKTTILFSDIKGQDIRPGMTANVRITTEIKNDVIVVPQRAVLEENDVTVVRILTNPKKGTFMKREVRTGLKGDGGMVEIVSGLSEGEEVVTFVKEK